MSTPKQQENPAIKIGQIADKFRTAVVVEIENRVRPLRDLQESFTDLIQLLNTIIIQKDQEIADLNKKITELQVSPVTKPATPAK